MSIELFGREFELLAYTKDGVGRRWVDIGLQFNILKTAGSEPNTATFTIFNLSEDSRGFLSRASSVALRAGYKNNVKSIFQGDISRVVSHKNGTTWTTEIECGDGEEALKKSTVQASVSAGASPMALVDSFKKSMKNIDFSEGFSTAIKKAVDNNSGTVISGSTSEELTAILEPAGYEWTIQDGVLEVVEAGKSIGGETLELRSDTGLLATKRIESPGKKKDAKGKDKGKKDLSGVEVSALLSGLIRINRPIKVVSETHGISGFFIPKTVRHVGDSGGPDWSTIAECIEA